jgi:hypothetical protein
MLSIETTNGSAALDTEAVRRFYKSHRHAIIRRMRQPTAPAKNVAAVVVSVVAKRRRLRLEALRALDYADRAREGQEALSRVMRAYGTPQRPSPRT